jgi:quercetin dioxygenase-like cupin family protein
VTGLHALIRNEEIELVPALSEHSARLRRAVLIGEHTGATHTGLSLIQLDDGRVDCHLHSFETSFYILTGEPILYLEDAAVRLKAGACGAIPVGAVHGWRSEGSARWIEMVSPRPRPVGEPPDTFFIGPTPEIEPNELDVRDPRNRNLFLLSSNDMNIDILKRGALVDEPTVSASMATAALAYSGITVKMLVDKRLDAQLQTMFMVAYQPGAVAHPHDHPFEESYVMLEGNVDVVADGARYTLHAGDVFWTGVGCIHAFYEVEGNPVLWLETSAPGPPDRYSYRFERDWDYLARRVQSESSVVVGDSAR